MYSSQNLHCIIILVFMAFVYLLLQEEKEVLQNGIDREDTDIILKMIEQESIDINANIAPVCIIMY